ncbi:MAG: MFS transporter [Terriglobia bacterium]|jgi:ACS family hexuronate transporter-like MFS transporter
MGSFRWRVCALLFFATTINYVDRQVLGLLAPLLQSNIGFNEVQYGYIVTAFQAAYALGLLAMGPIIDRIGTKLGYALSISIWSLAAMGHALVRSAFGFGAARFALGLGESGSFPAAIKTVAEWFPKKERALATGLLNCGTNVGATLAPLTVPWVAVHFGWRYAFLLTGTFSALWLVTWLVVYRSPQDHPRVTKTELAYILSDPAEPTTKISWSHLLGHRQTWAFVMGKSLTDPIWWFYLFWLAKFLVSEHHLKLTGVALPIVVIYNCATVGSIVGGWLPARFLEQGWTVNRARKISMLICSLCVIPVMMTTLVHGLWTAVAIISLACAAHQGFSANIFTLASDMFPRRAVASVVGMGGCGGAVGGMFIATFTGWLLQLTGSYLPVFIVAGSVYVVALGLVQLLAPRLQPAAID